MSSPPGEVNESVRTATARAAHHVAIVGGGISGLASAWYLQQLAAQQGIPLTYTLLEASPTLGGKIVTEQIDGYGDAPFIVEGGPDSFLTQKPWALQLARELGLGPRLLGTNDHLRKTYVLHHGEPTPLPDGVLLIVPTRFTPFARSPLISPWGKLRMGLEYFIPPKTGDEDETLAAFIRRRLGSEALDKIAEPLLSGIYSAESDKQSLLATFPRFRDMEKQHGSLIRGMLASRRPQTNGAAAPPAQSQPSPSMFMSLQGGTRELIDTLIPKLHGELRTGTTVAAIDAAPDGHGYRLHLENGDTLAADAVILAVPAYVAAAQLAPLAPQAGALLAGIRYVSTGTLSLAFRRDEITHAMQGFGIVIPRSERRPINAITWSSTKFDHRAPADHVLLRVFFGGSRNPAMMERTDDELLAIARLELDRIMGIQAAPVLHRIFRWPRANPQYDVGHLGRVAAIEAALPAGLWATGSPYRGIGIPDCVHQAQQTATQVMAFLREQPRVSA